MNTKDKPLKPRIQFATNISQVTRRQIDSLRELGLTNREIVSLGVRLLYLDCRALQVTRCPDAVTKWAKATAAALTD